MKETLAASTIRLRPRRGQFLGVDKIADLGLYLSLNNMMKGVERRHDCDCYWPQPNSIQERISKQTVKMSSSAQDKE